VNWGKVTKAFTVGGVLVIAVYDLAALAVGGADATISQAVGIEGSFDSPFIPFGLGVVMGHLFWPQKRSKRADE
jgi:hypothetical protein